MEKVINDYLATGKMYWRVEREEIRGKHDRKSTVKESQEG